MMQTKALKEIKKKKKKEERKKERKNGSGYLVNVVRVWQIQTEFAEWDFSGKTIFQILVISNQGPNKGIQVQEK